MNGKLEELLEILVVNYKTPDLIDSLLKSRDDVGYSNITTRVIDGSDTPEMIKAIQEVASKYNNVLLSNAGFNIHHGPGIVYGVCNTHYKQKYKLILDSDSAFNKAGAIEHLLSFMKDDIYMVGGICYVDRNGIGVAKREPNYPIAYLHPSRCLMNVDKYMQFKPPVKHGAPFISTMVDIHEKNAENVLAHVSDLNEWITTTGRGTVNRFSYNL